MRVQRLELVETSPGQLEFRLSGWMEDRSSGPPALVVAVLAPPVPAQEEPRVPLQDGSVALRIRREERAKETLRGAGRWPEGHGLGPNGYPLSWL
jgi:hypothetical protein